VARLYGGRWKIVDDLGTGGQSNVYRVVDERGEQPTEFALKRVLNPNRHERFRSEIEAISRLTHPNVVPLIDHSALDAEKSEEEKQFLVMPIAAGGDLSKPQRLSLYKDSIDSVIQIAKQMASALDAAHEKKIIHRDIKPQNILFTGDGHALWVADFGICLISDRPRITGSSEVVGPHAFMAPELEYGGQLDVTAAADVYSLGKVIYYAFTGGRVVPRELIDEKQYSEVFSGGERHRLLQLLLRQMICPLVPRLKFMSEVTKRLEEMEQWESQARVSPISSAGQASLERLQLRTIEARRIEAEHEAGRARRATTLATVVQGFHVWLKSELLKAATDISRGGVLRCAVQPLTSGKSETWQVASSQGKVYREVSGLELVLETGAGATQERHVLQIRLCKPQQITVTIQTAAFQSPVPPQASAEPDTELAIIPTYKKMSGSYPNPQGGFLTKKSSVGQMQHTVSIPRGRAPRLNLSQPTPRVTRTFLPEVSQCTVLRASEWPGVIDRTRESLTEAIDSFIEFVNSPSNIG
jgi:serine/threonine protein kinase